MRTFGCCHPKEALVRDMGVQQLIQPGNTLTAREPCLRRSGLALAQRCLPDPLRVRERSSRSAGGRDGRG